MQKNRSTQDKTLFATPFSKAYWKLAASEFKRLDILVFASLMVAIRVIMKIIRIPIPTTQDLNIQFAFLANAFGAMVFGPVVAVPAAIVSDFLGWLLVNPTGEPYFLPFVLLEIASSVIFALFLYRTHITVLRVFLSKFCINFLVNVIISVPIMRAYYAFRGFSTVYPLFDSIRIIKNLIMLPIEAVLLVLFLRAAVPASRNFGFVQSTVDRLVLDKRHILLLVLLFLIGTASTAGYIVYDYNHKSFSASYTQEERLAQNKAMNLLVEQELSQEDGNRLVTIIQSAHSKVGDPKMTYELIVYRIDEEAFTQKSLENPSYTLNTLMGYSKSKAKGDNCLIPFASGTIITNKHTGVLISIDLQILSD